MPNAGGADDVATAVADAALTWFQTTVPAKKHANNEHTVFSAIVLHQNEQFHVLSAGTGTKCVGRSGLCKDGYVLADSHAEAICRRSFLRYLYHDLQTPIESSVLFEAADDGRRQIKPTCHLYMYISEAPCGDAALYDLNDEALEEIHEAKLKRRKLDEQVTTVPCRTTGAKEAETTTHSNTLGLARVKSGRSDILESNRTVSMSCSDKLCKWLACGLQGRLLSQWFDPIILSGIVVSQDTQATPESLRHALRRCFDRAGVDTCAVWTTAKQFPLVRSHARTSASGLSLNWAALGTTDTDVEYTLGARGVKMGAKKKLDGAAKLKMRSRLSRRVLMEAALAHQPTPSPADDDDDAASAIVPPNCLSYGQLKAVQTSYAALQAAFLYRPAFREWKGTPPGYDEFRVKSS
ncbi:Aste57867_15537 [Aphanomyces stellatus]|uniref:Aste57867_15537 protein n=1 Tax=Aphanomyces stellatus TaxID=120398 RepID=A0A485L3M4_9STRA|nr:hypothetical protein As57867_015481 [Aphanomyces stellatus]VFT92339.1 Aste57867_15537 [Aphanomyces stellatus]